MNGCGQIELDSWQHYFDYVHQEMLNYGNGTSVWRGHRCDNWSLESTLDRLVKRAQIPMAEQDHFRRSHLEQFIFAARGRRGSNPPNIEEENNWWALGQHHGLASPLLDWTTSPFVAAYFAFIGLGQDQTGHRAVFALHREGVEAKVAELIKAEEEVAVEADLQRAQAEQPQSSSDGYPRLISVSRNCSVCPQVEFIRPLSDENQRLVNQGGLFTRAPDATTLESWVQKNYDDPENCILVKLLIPDKDREECLKTLNRMNINHLTLFPDLYGASKFCNLFAEIKNY